MTTDVINDVPRCLLREILRQAEQNGNDTMATRALGDLLATAKPADHSEHALNMAAPPAADGERASFEARINPRCRNRNEHGDYVMPEIQDRWDGWLARAAQPQQAVAVTDEVRRLREALEVCVEVIERFSYRWNGQGKHPQMALNGAKAALSAHKTGEEGNAN